MTHSSTCMYVTSHTPGFVCHRPFGWAHVALFVCVTLEVVSSMWGHQLQCLQQQLSSCASQSKLVVLSVHSVSVRAGAVWLVGLLVGGVFCSSCACLSGG